VSLHDDGVVAIEDLGANFFFTEADVGKNRVDAALKKCQVLNEYVDVNARRGPIDDAVLAHYGAVIVTSDVDPASLIAWDKFCHAHDKLFVLAINNGLTCTVFTDFGAVHLVKDPNGEPVKSHAIDRVDVRSDEQGNKFLVAEVAGEKHGLDDGDWVKFEGALGMDVLNKFEHLEVQRIFHSFVNSETKQKRSVLVPNAFRVVFPADANVDVASLPAYLGMGVMTQVKKSIVQKFAPLEQSLVNPQDYTDVGDGVKFALPLAHPNAMKAMMNAGNQLHVARLALWRFQSKRGALPKIHDAADAQEVVDLAKLILDEHRKLPPYSAIVLDDLDEQAVRNYALYARVELPGFTAFLGGVAAQEVVKKFGNFTPIRQWLHVDYFELLDANGVRPDTKPVGSRYDHQIAVFGAAFQKKLADQTWFMVGCGALGCEYLKGFALMGLACGGEGKLFVTDMDTIEVSNLNRQFLFRKENVHQPKSVTAANAARVMNSGLNVVCYETPVGPTTENVFTDVFWSQLDGVCNALDNVEARKFTDGKCVFFGKPLLESGTLGTKANSEVIIPFKTRSYSDSKDAEEGESIPMCTLRNFPHLIEHCIEWARAQFNDLFVDPANDLDQFLRDKDAFLKQLESETDPLPKLKKLMRLLDAASGEFAFEQCMIAARDSFEGGFSSNILNLVHLFPRGVKKPDPVTKQEVPFWSGSKRFPQAAAFDINDRENFDFLFTTANLFAFMYNVPQLRNVDEFRQRWAKLGYAPKAWAPDVSFMKKVESEVELEDSKKMGKKSAEPAVHDESAAEIAEVNALKSALAQLDISRIKPLVAASFEKDDDSNFHIDFVTACSNNRAYNYHIPKCSRHKCKMIAGKIIPAVATTTAMITGLVELEFYKILLGLPKDQFLNSNINLGLGMFEAFEPEHPIPAKGGYDVIMMCDVKPVPEGFNRWHKIEIDLGKDVTVQELVEAFPKIHHGCQLEMLNKHGITQADVDAGKARPIYIREPLASQREFVETNLKRPVSEVYRDLYGDLGERKYVLLDGDATLEDDPVLVPVIKYTFRK
jgi:ubiquitin-activating enzyme E1